MGWVLFHSQRFVTLVFESSGFAIGVSCKIWLFTASGEQLFVETMFLRYSVSLAAISGAIPMWSLLKIHLRIQRSISKRFGFPLRFCFNKESFPLPKGWLYSQDSTSWCTKYIVDFHYASACPTSTNNLTSL